MNLCDVGELCQDSELTYSPLGQFLQCCNIGFKGGWWESTYFQGRFLRQKRGFIKTPFLRARGVGDRQPFRALWRCSLCRGSLVELVVETFLPFRQVSCQPLFGSSGCYLHRSACRSRWIGWLVVIHRLTFCCICRVGFLSKRWYCLALIHQKVVGFSDLALHF